MVKERGEEIIEDREDEEQVDEELDNNPESYDLLGKKEEIPYQEKTISLEILELTKEGDVNVKVTPPMIDSENNYISEMEFDTRGIVDYTKISKGDSPIEYIFSIKEYLGPVITINRHGSFLFGKEDGTEKFLEARDSQKLIDCLSALGEDLNRAIPKKTSLNKLSKDLIEILNSEEILSYSNLPENYRRVLSLERHNNYFQSYNNLPQDIKKDLTLTDFIRSYEN